MFQIFMCLTYGFVKCSIIWFYRRIFLVHRFSTFDIVSSVVGLAVALWTVAFSIAFTTYCAVDLWAAWAPLPIQNRYCGNDYAILESMAISDLVLDVVVLLLPFPSVCSVRLGPLTTMLEANLHVPDLDTASLCVSEIADIERVLNRSDVSSPQTPRTITVAQRLTLCTGRSRRRRQDWRTTSKSRRSPPTRRKRTR